MSSTAYFYGYVYNKLTVVLFSAVVLFGFFLFFVFLSPVFFGSHNFLEATIFLKLQIIKLGASFALDF